MESLEVCAGPRQFLAAATLLFLRLLFYYYYMVMLVDAVGTIKASACRCYTFPTRQTSRSFIFFLLSLATIRLLLSFLVGSLPCRTTPSVVVLFLPFLIGSEELSFHLSIASILSDRVSVATTQLSNESVREEREKLFFLWGELLLVLPIYRSSLFYF